MIGPVQSCCHEGSTVGKVGRICWKGRFWAWSERVMDDESGDDNRDELEGEWGGESRHDWRGWRKESGSWFHRRGDAYLNERSVIYL